MFHAARKAGTFARRGLHVPPASADGEAGRAGQIRRDRRGADDQVELRLRHAAASCRSTGSSPTISPAAASSMSAAIRSRWRGLIAGAAAGKPFLDPVKVAGAAHLGAVRRRRMGGGRAARSRTASSPRSPARSRSTQDNVLRILGTEGPHRGAGLLVRRRQPRGRHRQDRHHPRDGTRETIERQRRPASSIPSRSMPRARRSAPAGRNSPRRA